MHTIALLLEEPHHPREHIVVAAPAKAEQERDRGDGAEIKPDIAEIGTGHAADDDEVLAPVIVQRGE